MGKKIESIRIVNGVEFSTVVSSDPLERIENMYIDSTGSLPFTPHKELDAYMNRLTERDPMEQTKLRALRESKGIHVGDMPLLLGISQVAYLKIEFGLSFPKLPLAFKIAKLLGTTVDELFGAD